MRSQMKAYYYYFLFWVMFWKNCLKKFEFSQKMYFLRNFLTFFFVFCRHMLDFNKSGLKWKLTTTASSIEEKNLIFFSKTWNFCKTCNFFKSNFIFDFKCQDSRRTYIATVSKIRPLAGGGRYKFPQRIL